MAVFCEKVLREGPVMSLIRVVDRFHISGQTRDMAPARIAFTMVIAFKSGFSKGKYDLTVKPKSPTGKDLPTFGMPILLEGDDQGAAIAMEVSFQADEEGLYWFEVYLNEVLVTQMPLRVVYGQSTLVTRAEKEL
jgi:hypothetical protein